MKHRTRFFKPRVIRTTYGSIFDMQGNLIDLHERGLDGDCDSTQGGKHDWLLLPREEAQKQYISCLKCLEVTHL
jgi:hypothetical protein